jgi:hypothetical protein
MPYCYYFWSTPLRRKYLLRSIHWWTGLLTSSKIKGCLTLGQELLFHRESSTRNVALLPKDNSFSPSKMDMRQQSTLHRQDETAPEIFSGGVLQVGPTDGTPA